MKKLFLELTQQRFLFFENLANSVLEGMGHEKIETNNELNEKERGIVNRVSKVVERLESVLKSRNIDVNTFPEFRIHGEKISMADIANAIEDYQNALKSPYIQDFQKGLQGLSGIMQQAVLFMIEQGVALVDIDKNTDMRNTIVRARELLEQTLDKKEKKEIVLKRKVFLEACVEQAQIEGDIRTEAKVKLKNMNLYKQYESRVEKLTIAMSPKDLYFYMKNNLSKLSGEDLQYEIFEINDILAHFIPSIRGKIKDINVNDNGKIYITMCALKQIGNNNMPKFSEIELDKDGSYSFVNDVNHFGNFVNSSIKVAEGHGAWKNTKSVEFRDYKFVKIVNDTEEEVSEDDSYEWSDDDGGEESDENADIEEIDEEDVYEDDSYEENSDDWSEGEWKDEGGEELTEEDFNEMNSEEVDNDEDDGEGENVEEDYKKESVNIIEIISKMSVDEIFTWFEDTFSGMDLEKQKVQYEGISKVLNNYIPGMKGNIEKISIETIDEENEESEVIIKMKNSGDEIRFSSWGSFYISSDEDSEYSIYYDDWESASKVKFENGKFGGFDIDSEVENWGDDFDNEPIKNEEDKQSENNSELEKNEQSLHVEPSRWYKHICEMISESEDRNDAINIQKVSQILGKYIDGIEGNIRNVKLVKREDFDDNVVEIVMNGDISKIILTSSEDGSFFMLDSVDSSYDLDKNKNNLNKKIYCRYTTTSIIPYIKFNGEKFIEKENFDEYTASLELDKAITRKEQINFGDVSLHTVDVMNLKNIPYNYNFEVDASNETIKLMKDVFEEQENFYKMCGMNPEKGALQIEDANFVKDKLLYYFTNLTDEQKEECGIKSTVTFDSMNPSQAYYFINNITKDIFTYDTSVGKNIRIDGDSYSIDKYLDTAGNENGVCRNYAGFVERVFEFYKSNIVAGSQKQQYKNIHVMALGGEIDNVEGDILGDGTGHAWNAFIDLGRKIFAVSDVTWNDKSKTFENLSWNNVEEELLNLDADDKYHLNKSALALHLLAHSKQVPRSVTLLKSYVENFENKKEFLLEIGDVLHAMDRFDIANAIYKNVGIEDDSERMQNIQKNKQKYVDQKEYGSSHTDEDREMYQKLQDVFGELLRLDFDAGE